MFVAKYLDDGKCTDLRLRCFVLFFHSESVSFYRHVLTHLYIWNNFSTKKNRCKDLYLYLCPLDPQKLCKGCSAKIGECGWERKPQLEVLARMNKNAHWHQTLNWQLFFSKLLKWDSYSTLKLYLFKNMYSELWLWHAMLVHLITNPVHGFCFMRLP